MKKLYALLNTKLLVFLSLIIFSYLTGKSQNSTHNLFPANGFASIAFEDLWPAKGDYDMNDIVVDCKFDQITNSENKVTQIQAQIVLRAMGAAFHNGFGIQLPVTPDKVSGCVVKFDNGEAVPISGMVSIDSKGLEQGQDKAVVILFDDGFLVLPQNYPGIGVNTALVNPWTETRTINMTINFSEPVDPNLLVAPYNPFIFANSQRGAEIHLPNCAPTSLANKSLFKTLDDDSNVSTFNNPASIRSYLTKDNLPWAIFFYKRFDYPIEKAAIIDAYHHFAEWAQSDGSAYPDWYFSTASGYRDDSKIYLHAQGITEPSVSTSSITNITATTASAGGNVTSDGGSTVTLRGVCWSTTQNPTIANSKTTDGTGTGSFTSSITGLTANTSYYIRAYATNSNGTSYGSQQTLKTLNAGDNPTVTDIEGNVYHTVTIGTQTWMVENLKVTKYNDGSPITQVTDSTQWVFNPGFPSIPHFIWYRLNEAKYKNTYGALYNSFVINSGKLCPPGWHVPSSDEWTTLTSYLGGEDVAGGKMKEAGTSHWISPNVEATNESGFTALPGGYFYDVFFENAHDGYWWSSTPANESSNWVYYIPSSFGKLIKINGPWCFGFSIRCIKDKDDVAKQLPTLFSHLLYNITSTVASTCEGAVICDGGSAITARGICWSLSPNPTISDFKTSNGTGFGSFSGDLTGLTENTTYYVRSYATNSLGTGYGFQQSFRTLRNKLPTLITSPVSDITVSTATSGGNITNEPADAVTLRGVCWSTNQNPTVLDSKTIDGLDGTTFTSNLTGLIANTTYYVRSYATNGFGTAYGDQQSFTTLSNNGIIFNPNLTYGSVTDVEGNVYKTITIGTQTWMAENLKTTKFNDGTAIPLVTDNTAWGNLTTPGFSWFNNDASTSKNTYGALYNWYAVNTHKLCPQGWHVPSDGEWDILTNYLGGATIAGAKLKEEGTAHWVSPNTGATNSSGFTALPAGYRVNADPSFSSITYGTFLWSSTSYGVNAAYARYMRSLGSEANQNGTTMESGFSVRCVKDDPSNKLPVLTTTAISSITSVTAVSGGTVISDGGVAITERGICWNTTGNPLVTDNKTSDGTGTGSFLSNLSGLTANTSYFLRAYASNSYGTTYGNLITFTTPSFQIPLLVTTLSVSNISSTTATAGGTVMADGGSTVTARGVCWSSTTNPTTADSKTTDGTGVGNFTSALTGLTANTTYYLRSYAINSAVTSYGEQKTFTTLGNVTLPTVSTAKVTGINPISVNCESSVRNDGGAQVTVRGVCWSTSDNPTISDAKTSDGSGIGTFTSNVTNLSPNTTYKFRAYATNSAGTAYGEQLSYITPAMPLLVMTVPNITFTQTTAIVNGNATSDGGSPISARGFCWSTNASPTLSDNTSSSGSGLGQFSATISGLTPNTLYYIRAYATNGNSTAYSNQLTFTTQSNANSTVTDIDGNVYTTVVIGDQTWMVENLKTTKYRNGDPISYITDNKSWGSATSQAYCYPNNNETMTDIGLFYNWYAVSDNRNLAPKGWHIPAPYEYQKLIDYLGTPDVAFTKLAKDGVPNWINMNIRRTNDSGFSGLPGGRREIDGYTYYTTHEGDFWTINNYDIHTAFNFQLNILNGYAKIALPAENKSLGLSVRCIKDY